MVRINSDFQNISNYFVEAHSLGHDLNQVLESIHDSIFGVEMRVSSEGATQWVVAPPYVRLRSYNAVNTREVPRGAFAAFEGSLSKPFFLPLYDALKGRIWDDIAELPLLGNEKVYLQLLFRRKPDEWRELALDMYGSYLDGSEHPFASRFGRKLQDRALSLLNRIYPYEPHEYIDAVEHKIRSEGFQFQMRLAIESDRVPQIRTWVEEVLRAYDAHNSLCLYKTSPKSFRQLYEACTLSGSTSTQILSREELLSLIGKEGIAPSQPTGVSVPPKTDNVLQLLPFHSRQEVTADDTLVPRIADALKRVKLIKKAQLYNESLVAGIRLTVLQCDIPKEKNLSDIIKKQKDIGAALGVHELTIEQGDAPDTVKFSIPNEHPAVISVRELVEAEEFQTFARNHPLAFPVGVDEINNPIYLSLSKLVHLLITGKTGSGKSVFLNSFMVSLLTHYTPEELQFTLIDPKAVELQQYEGFPHVREVITDMNYAYSVLEKLTVEMDKRYALFKESNAKNIAVYNQKAEEKLPYRVCVIEEYADLHATHSEVNEFVMRLGQKARAAGIHLVLVTQRPSVDVLDGKIKANIPSAISFSLNNSTDYKTVFGKTIPQSRLLGEGDGVMRIEGASREFQRFQSAMLSPDEAEEAEVYNNLKEYYEGREYTISEEVEITEDITSLEEPMDKDLYKLKQVIATTGETRVDDLRKEIGVKMNRMTGLMSILVEEGWLVKHKSRAKGYELVASEDVLSEWRTD
jgi:DNA segregation ATPase FtsK/SpoIIIE, S-DNA-T family